jgi:hypothetical protein
MTQRGSSDTHLIRLMDVRLKPAGGDWMELARGAPGGVR